MSVPRPSSIDTETDLLALQQEFLATQQRPAARVSQVGEKRKKPRREVVELTDSVAGTKQRSNGNEPARITAKVTSTSRKSVSGPPTASESAAVESPPTLIVKGVQEKAGIGSVRLSPFFHAEQGFPTAKKLQAVTTPVKNKSLFAQQFDESRLEGYGLRPNLPSCGHQESGSNSAFGFGPDRFEHGALVSGHGLVSAGVSPDLARQEVLQIQEENLQQLSLLSEKEIMEEQHRIRDVLGPNLTAFLLAKKKQPFKVVPTRPEGGTVASVTDSEEEAIVGGGDRKETSLFGNKWLNMDVVERDKMEWMTDVTVENVTFTQQGDVRFSLDALTIPRDISMSIPTHLGLHHHGEESIAAGYTLDELLHLAQSSVPQQRVLALQTLAVLVTRARHSEYSFTKPRGPDLSALLASGEFPFLLRCCLDESGTGVQVAALNCLHGLLVSPPEEQLLDEQCSSFFGLSLPALSPHREGKVSTLAQKTDMEVMKKDVIKGLLRMQLLPRLRYLLEVCQPPVSVKVLMLEILGRVCRHSVEAANQVADCPRLVNAVIMTCLPATWTANDPDTHPVPQAMKLLRLACAASERVAVELVGNHGVTATVLRHGVTAPSQLVLPPDTSYKLCIEALKTWAVLLRHGQTYKIVRDVFPQLIILIYRPAIPVSKLELLRLIAVLQLLEAVVHCTMNLDPKNAVLDWTHVHSLLEHTLNWLPVCENECSGEDRFNWMRLLGNVVSILAAIFAIVHERPQLLPNTIEALELADMVSSKVLPTLLPSNFSLVATHCFCVSLEAIKQTTPVQSPPTLPAHFTPSPSSVKPAVYGKPHMTTDDYPRLAQSFSELGASTGLLLAVLRLGLSLVWLHQNVAERVYAALDLGRVLGLHHTVSQVQAPCKISVHLLLFDILRLVTTTLRQGQSSPLQNPNFTSSVTMLPQDLIHEASLSMTLLLPAGFEYCLLYLLSSIIFLPSFYTRAVDQQCLGPPERCDTLCSEVGSSKFGPPYHTLLSEALRNLPSIQSTYLDQFSAVLTKKAVIKSRQLLTGQAGDAVSLLLPPASAPLLPRDWVFLPVISQYTQALQGNATLGVGPQDIVPIVNSLRFLLLLEWTNSPLLAGISHTTRLARIMCVFLAGSDLFLEERVHEYLSTLLHCYCAPGVMRSLDLSETIPGLASFADLYSSLLDQFVAVSYGDHLFASYLALPLQQQHDAHFRTMFWNDYPTIYRVFSLPLAQVPASLSEYLQPEEHDPVLLRLYMNALGTGLVRQEWSPFLFIVAVHHIHSFLFSCESEEGKHPLRKALLLGTLQLKDKALQRQLLLYSGHTCDGLQLAPALSDHQKNVISLYCAHEGPPF